MCCSEDLDEDMFAEMEEEVDGNSQKFCAQM